MTMLIACSKEIPFPDIEDDPQIVVNSLFNPDGDLKVHVSESCHIQDSLCGMRFLSDAEVVLLDKDGSVLSNLVHTGEGVYRSDDYSITHNTIYQLEVSSERSNLAEVKTKSHVPKTVSSTIIELEEALVNGQLVWAFDIEIDDDPDADNYYIIEGNFDIVDGSHQEGFSNVEGYEEPHFSHFTDDPNADNKELAVGLDFESYGLRSVFLKDINFNGNKYKTRIGIRDHDLNYGSAKNIKANIFVKSVSAEMYEYLKSLEELRLRRGAIFSEPKQIYTNIENGLGIFAGYAQQEFNFDLPESQYKFPSMINVTNDGCTGPCTVKFSADGGAKLQYLWDFGDGQTSKEPIVDHLYDSPGDYLVRFNVDNGNGSGANFDIMVTIK